uniref:F-box domain-containing protein n=1 Tax=Caenorhabditis tropicalis TaxID=1561998 RepID=A0A1I7UN04_9PELO
MAFHLFRLPESIYIDIINTMNPCEQFFTSLCSRKTYSIIKIHRRAIKNLNICTEGDFEFHLYDYETTYMKFHQSSEIPNQKLEELMIDGNSIRYELKEDNVVTTYWAEPREGTMKLIEYVCDLFDIVVRFIEIHCDSGDRLMKWVQRRQARLDTVCFTSKQCEENQFTPETLKSLIMDCEAESIVLNAYTTQPLQIEKFDKKYHLFDVTIGAWFTLEHLMTLDCIDISVTGRQFKSTEMNRFFKHWMSGSSPRLKRLEVKLDNYNEQELMDGIDVKWNMRTMHVTTDDVGAITTFDGFNEIQKITNGMSAGFKFKYGLLCFGVWPCSFPLFRLPQLASMNIINEMNQFEQFLTSLCSRRAFSTIKTLRRKSKDITMSAGIVCLVIDKGAERLVIAQFGEDSRREEIVTVNGKSARFAYDVENSTINTFWAEPIVGTMELVEHVSSLFDIQVDKVVITKKDSGTRLMNWVQTRQRSLRMLEVLSFNEMEDQFESEDLKNIILECKAENIHLNALHSSPFEIQSLNKKFKVFECLRGTWITVDNLMTLDCISITVEGRRFTCAELNRFIKSWLQGRSPRLGVLRVSAADYNFHELFDGLDARLSSEKIVIQSGHLNAFNGFFEVVRSDGITAGFKFFPDFFWFGVWPRDNGNVLYLDSL